jgi:large subunit ribosomal protein L6
MFVFFKHINFLFYKRELFFIGLNGIIKIDFSSIILGLKVYTNKSYFNIKVLNNDKYFLNLKNYIYLQIIKVLLLLNNSFRKKIIFFGIGFRSWLCNYKSYSSIILKIGSSRDICIKIPLDISVVSIKPTLLLFESFNKNKLYQFVAFLKSLKKIDLYKGKGVRYFDELIVLKQGKHN